MANFKLRYLRKPRSVDMAERSFEAVTRWNALVFRTLPEAVERMEDSVKLTECSIRL